MARICVFNTSKVLDTAGNPYTSRLVSTGASPAYTKPVRLFTIDGLVQNLDYEFIWVSSTGQNCDLRFYQQFYNDRPQPGTPPSDDTSRRLVSGLGASGLLTIPWAREVTEEVSTTLNNDTTDNATSNVRLVNHYYIQRSVTLVPQPAPDPSGFTAACVSLPFIVRGLWSRLAVWINGTIPSVAVDGSGNTLGQLLIYAHVGGHGEEGYLEANEFIPYAYNA